MRVLVKHETSRHQGKDLWNIDSSDGKSPSFICNREKPGLVSLVETEDSRVVCMRLYDVSGLYGWDRRLTCGLHEVVWCVWSVWLRQKTHVWSAICTLFKITFLEKWDEHGEHPFLWPLTSFPDHHTYSVHSVQYYLSSCFEQFHWDLIIIRTCGFATCCLTDGTSNLWTNGWRLLLPIFLFNFFPFFIMVQVFTIPLYDHGGVIIYK